VRNDQRMRCLHDLSSKKEIKMMNVQSKKYRIRSESGGFTITNLQTNQNKFVSKAPEIGVLSSMSEKEFDKAMEQLFC